VKLIRIATIGVAIVVAAAVIITTGIHDKSMAALPPVKKVQVTLPATPGSYLGVYMPPSPTSFAGVTAFSSLIGVQPDVDMYYSGWLEPFQARFATSAARHGAVPLVQIDPTDVKLKAITSGKYDAYLISFADAVRSYGRPVILGFGHEMNGTWYSWADGHTSPAAFVAAWRHIVNLFREVGAGNVTWLWTINIVETQAGIPSPVPWWPGSSYVTWVGIDGYYTKSSVTFAPLFGPTIVAVRALTNDPILIAETAAGSAAGQPAKIADLFAGIGTYGLLGFVWFDAIGEQDWRLSSPAAVAAFRQGAEAYRQAGS
jgi:hypothetical protein